MSEGRVVSDDEERSAARRLTVRHRDGSRQMQYKHQDYVRALQKAWELVCDQALGLTERSYSHLVAEGKLEGPSAVRVIQVFKTWRAALDAANVPAVAPMRTYQSSWSENALVQAIGEYLSDPSTSGTYAGWDGWRREARPDAPSAQTLRNRLGSWSQAKAKAVEHLASANVGSKGHG